MPAVVGSVFRRAHADLQPCGFAGAALHRLAWLLDRPDPVGPLAARVVEDGDDSALGPLHDALMESGESDARCGLLLGLCRYWESDLARSWRNFPISWAVCLAKWRLDLTVRYRRPQWIVTALSGERPDWSRWRDWEPRLGVRSYKPGHAQVVRFPRAADAGMFLAVCFRRRPGCVVVPVRGFPNVSQVPEGFPDGY